MSNRLMLVILLMVEKSGVHQLSLVAYATIYMVFYILSVVVLDFWTIESIAKDFPWMKRQLILSSAEELRWRARGEDIVAVNSGGSYGEPKWLWPGLLEKDRPTKKGECLCYCWWKKSGQPPEMYKNLVNNGMNYLSTGTGFFPSTVFLASSVVYF